MVAAQPNCTTLSDSNSVEPRIETRLELFLTLPFSTLAARCPMMASIGTGSSNVGLFLVISSPPSITSFWAAGKPAAIRLEDTKEESGKR